MSLVDDLKKKWESALNPEPYVQEKAEEALVGPKEDKAMRAFNESEAATNVNSSTVMKAPTETPLEIEQPLEVEQPLEIERVETNPFKEGFYQATAQTLFKEDAPETEEEREQRKKRERARNTLFNFADIGAHIANMWGAQGGASAIDVSSMSDAHRKRMDIAKENRDRNKDAYRRSIFQAIAMDQQANVAEQVRLQQRADRKEDISFRDKQYENTLDQQRYSNEVAKQKIKNDLYFKEAELILKEDSLELKKEKNAIDKKVANARIGQLNAYTRSYQLKTPEGKNLTYTPQPYAFEYDSDYNGVPIKKTMIIEVPKELKGSFISIVYNEMVTHAKKLDDERTTALAVGEKTNVQMIRETFESFSEGSSEPTSSKMETAMLTHAANLGLQEFIDDQSTRISRAYIKHLAKPDRTEGVGVHNITIPIENVDADVAVGAVGGGLTAEEAQWLSDNDISVIE